MLSDPLPLVFLPTVAITGGSPTSLRRVANGKYVCAEAPFTLDQQARFTVTPTIKPVGYNTTRTRLEIDKNVAGPIGVSMPDDTLTSDIVLKWNPRSHNTADALAILDSHYQIVRSNLARLQFGES